MNCMPSRLGAVLHYLATVRRFPCTSGAGLRIGGFGSPIAQGLREWDFGADPGASGWGTIHCQGPVEGRDPVLKAAETAAGVG
jgi:hypothetical protein